MPTIYRTLALCAGWFALTGAVGYADGGGIEQQMSAAEFSAAGLDRLTAAELQALNAWLSENRNLPGNASITEPKVTESEIPEPVAATAAAVPEVAGTGDDPGPNFGLSDSQIRAAEPESKQRERVLTRIDGQFVGWSGKTRFKLQNGQVWRQRSGGSYYHRAMSPEVEVYRNRLGFYMLRVVEINRSIGVKRLE